MKRGHKIVAAAAGFLMCATAASAEVLSLPVPVRTIFPNDQIAASDFVMKEFVVNESIKRNYLLTPNGVERSVAMRVLPAGKPIVLRALRRKADVEKGKGVMARYVSGGVEIQGFLIPEQDGTAGQVIKAKNPQTGVVVPALVHTDGSLLVGLQ